MLLQLSHEELIGQAACRVPASAHVLQRTWQVAMVRADLQRGCCEMGHNHCSRAVDTLVAMHQHTPSVGPRLLQKWQRLVKGVCQNLRFVVNNSQPKVLNPETGVALEVISLAK